MSCHSPIRPRSLARCRSPRPRDAVRVNTRFAPPLERLETRVLMCADHLGHAPNIPALVGSNLMPLEEDLGGGTLNGGPVGLPLNYTATLTSGDAGDTLAYTVVGTGSDATADRMLVNATLTAAVQTITIDLNRTLGSPDINFGLRFNLNLNVTNSTGQRVTAFQFALEDFNLGPIDGNDGFHPGEAHFHPGTPPSAPNFGTPTPATNPSQAFALVGGANFVDPGQTFRLGDTVSGTNSGPGVHAAECV